MIRFFLSISIAVVSLLVVTNRGFAQAAQNAQSLEEFQRSFTEDCVSLGQERDRDLGKLAGNYITALRELGEKAKQSGNLDAVLPVRDEIAAVEGSKWPLPLLGKTAPKRLRELRDTYVEERGKIEKEYSRRVSELVGKTTDLLKQREVELTKAGDVDGALAVREMVRLISSDPALQTFKEVAKGGLQNAASVTLEEILKGRIWTYRSGDSTCNWTFLDGQRITSDGWSKPSKWETKDNRILIIHYGGVRIPALSTSETSPIWKLSGKQI